MTNVSAISSKHIMVTLIHQLEPSHQLVQALFLSSSRSSPTARTTTKTMWFLRPIHPSTRYASRLNSFMTNGERLELTDCHSFYLGGILCILISNPLHVSHPHRDCLHRKGQRVLTFGLISCSISTSNLFRRYLG